MENKNEELTQEKLYAVFEQLCGADEDGDPKTVVSLKYDMIDVNSGDTIKEITPGIVAVSDAIVNIHCGEFFTQLDLIFPSSHSAGLRQLWTYLERKNNDLDEMERNPDINVEKTGIPIVRMMLMPQIINTEYDYVVFNDPIMQCLTPLDPQKDINTLRIIFLNDNVVWYHGDDVDFSSLDMEVEAELRHIQAVNERGNAEREQRLARIRKIEELKKNNDSYDEDDDDEDDNDDDE